MSTSQRTINQVRSILGRLDRSIDEARDRRLNGTEPNAEAASAEASSNTTGAERATTTTPPGRAAVDAPPPVGPARATPKPPSPFGRAKPLRKTGNDEAAQGTWNR